MRRVARPTTGFLRISSWRSAEKGESGPHIWPEPASVPAFPQGTMVHNRGIDGCGTLLNFRLWSPPFVLLIRALTLALSLFPKSVVPGSPACSSVFSTRNDYPGGRSTQRITQDPLRLLRVNWLEHPPGALTRTHGWEARTTSQLGPWVLSVFLVLLNWPPPLCGTE